MTLGDVYRVYDRVLTWMGLPSLYCSQCEKRIRHWVYHFNGLVYCQSCADEYVASLELSQDAFSPPRL